MTLPGFWQTLPVWLRIGLLSFGGPAAQIALMHRVIVDEHRWVSEQEYLRALSFCMLLPGPEAMQVATYVGWRMHGVRGGLAAGLLFVLPGACVIMALSILYAVYGTTPSVTLAFQGIKAAILVVVAQALVRVFKRSLTQLDHWMIAGLTFIGLFVLQMPYPVIILVAAVYGFCKNRHERSKHEVAEAPTVTASQTLRTLGIWLVLWSAPLLAVATLVPQPVVGQIGLFFSQLAAVTFGGAYAVLAYMAQDAVSVYGWLSVPEMLDGLGLAETTPGPLILVTQFVGFLATSRADGTTSIGMGSLGAIVALWATFAPCFLWIFVGGPYITWLTAKPRLRNALTAISAAVVGVILKLTVWFALHVLFGQLSPVEVGYSHIPLPVFSSIDTPTLALSLLAAVLLLRFKCNLLVTLAICASVLPMVSLSGQI